MNEKKKKEDVEVRYSSEADDDTKDLARRMASIFNGPLFASAVRQAVEEMVMEGKLTYDPEEKTVDLPIDVVKRWALKREKEGWE